MAKAPLDHVATSVVVAGVVVGSAAAWALPFAVTLLVGSDAIDDQLEGVRVVLDAFDVVKLATKIVDDVRRRVQQQIHGHRGRTGDPLTASATCCASARSTSPTGNERGWSGHGMRLGGSGWNRYHHHLDMACHLIIG